jgi:hypothetical protein
MSSVMNTLALASLGVRKGEDILKKVLRVAGIEACSKMVESTVAGSHGEMAIAGTLGPDLSKVKFSSVGFPGVGF